MYFGNRPRSHNCSTVFARWRQWARLIYTIPSAYLTHRLKRLQIRYIAPPHFPQKCAPSRGERPPYLGPIRPITPNGTSIDSAVFTIPARCHVDRETDTEIWHTTRPVRIDRLRYYRATQSKKSRGHSVERILLPRSSKTGMSPLPASM